jgi:hypothetical protein
MHGRPEDNMSIYCICGDGGRATSAITDYETEDPALTGGRGDFDAVRFDLTRDQMNGLFFDRYGIDYISRFFMNGRNFRVLSFPKATNTCYEKAEILANWDPLNVIKALYFECLETGFLYAAVIPETGCFIDKNHFAQVLDLSHGVRLAQAKNLPKNMTYGTCSPFISDADLPQNGGCVRRIVFDSEALTMKKHENTLDDFSFGQDHRFSIQMNYYQCYKMLKYFFGKVIPQESLLKLAFKEKLTRKNGRIKIAYEFESLNYRTASFINGIHGYGDVTITNDHVDELDIPEVLIRSNSG